MSDAAVRPLRFVVERETRLGLEVINRLHQPGFIENDVT